MKKLLFTLALLILAAFTLLYAVPQHLMQHETAAAAPTLALLQPAPEPQPPVKNGIDALWLLPYRTENNAERARIMREHGAAVMRGETPRELADILLPQPQNDELTCGRNGIECLAAVRAKPAAYRAATEKYAALAANVAQLAAYDTFAQRGWPNDTDNLAELRLPAFQHLLHAPAAAAATEWVNGQHTAAFARLCRSIRTGRALLNGRPGLIYPMIGNAIIRKNTELAAAMLAEQPEQADRLPQECDGMFAPLTPAEQSICPAMRDEFHSAANLYRTLAQFPLQTSQSLAADNGQADSQWLAGIVPIPTMNAGHAAARTAYAYAPACLPQAAAQLARDQAVSLPPPPPHRGTQKRAGRAQAPGRLGTPTALPDHTAYARRLQDTAMQQRAFQAALELYRLPKTQRRAALQTTLAAHATPARRLTWDEATRTLTFPHYTRTGNNTTPPPNPLRLAKNPPADKGRQKKHGKPNFTTASRSLVGQTAVL